MMLSTTPKGLLHAVFADHKDAGVTCKFSGSSSPCIHQEAINCHFDNLVVNSVYYFESVPASSAVCAVFKKYYSGLNPATYTSPANDRENKGPPALQTKTITV